MVDATATVRGVLTRRSSHSRRLGDDTCAVVIRTDEFGAVVGSDWGDTDEQERTMLTDSAAYSGFSVDDLDAARRFYTDVLGLTVADGGPGFTLELAGGTSVLVYPTPTHRPGSYTVLNFPVDDVAATVAGLTARGVRFERYEGTESAMDEAGVFRGGGPLIAWFTDPAGNILSVIAANS
jgi:catechol 2,3-dioxygenase-like lactoylglutathione lyase family enzyme